MTSSTTPVPAARAAHRSPAVYWWLTSLGLSLIGDQIYFIALAWAAVQVASPAQVGLVLAAGSVPRLILLLYGGALSDRFGAKRLALSSDISRVLVLAATAATIVATGPSLTLLIILALVFGALDALLLPAVGALPARLVEIDQMARLQGMRMTVQRACMIAGAPLAGYLVARHGFATALGFTTVLLAMSVVTLAATRLLPMPVASGAPVDSPDGQKSRFTGRLARDVADGLRYVRHHRLLPALLLVSTITEFGFTGPINTGLPLLAAARDWDSGGIGWILGGFGLGAATTAALLAVVGRLPHAGLLISGSAAAMGVALTGIGYAPTLLGAVAAAILLGLASGVSGSLIGALTLAYTQPDRIGRVMSLSSLTIFGCMPVSYAATGLLAERYGPSTTFVLGGLIAFAAAITGAATPPVRGARLPDSAGPGSVER